MASHDQPTEHKLVEEDLFVFENEGNDDDISELTGTYNILIVDDEEAVHTVTKMALKEFRFNNHDVNFISAYSEKEARELLSTKDDFAVAFIDVVMETNKSGLNLVEFIRDELGNKNIRIIIRTGQPGEAPEKYVIDNYDINDYKEKTELTSGKLYTTLRTSLAQYSQILGILNNKNELYKQLVTDSLTGLPNRTMLNYDLDSKNHASLVLINIDRFSVINETYGFSIGNELLLHVTKLLQKILHSKMKLYHLEADNFAIAIHEQSKAFICDKIDEIKTLIKNIPLEFNHITLHISITIGSVYDEMDNIIQKAEMALKQARSISRNRVEFYSQELENERNIEQNSLWTNRIAHAIESGKILNYYQPIIECESGKIVKYESLVRLEHEGEIISPFFFLNIARQAGYLQIITRIVFNNACKKFQDNQLKFSINITDHDLADPDCVDNFEKTRNKYQIDTSRIVLELLEETSLSSNPLAMDNIKRFIDLGYGCSIDDFGTECSNFQQLDTHVLESLKIDGKFIKDIDTNKKSKIITEAIIFYTQKVGIKTVAEFVHSQEVFEIIKELGVTYAQGYYFGEPKPELIKE